MSRDTAYTMRKGQTYAQRTLMGPLTGMEQINGVGPIWRWAYEVRGVTELAESDLFVQMTPTASEGGASFAVITHPVNWPQAPAFVYGQVVASIAYEMIRSAYAANRIIGHTVSGLGVVSYVGARMTYPAMLAAFTRVLDMPVTHALSLVSLYATGIPADLMWWRQPEVNAAKHYRRLGRVAKGGEPTYALSLCHDWLTDVMMSRKTISERLMKGSM